MKKLVNLFICLILTSILVGISSFGTAAETVYQYDGFSYTILNNQSVTICGWDNRSSVVAFPNKINTRKVISISNSAFLNNDFITEVNFDNATELYWIGSFSFSGCTALKSVSLPSQITHIGTAAFEDCSSLETLEYNASVNYVPDQCFNRCSSLKSVILSPGVETIGNYAFGDCSSLEYIEIPDTVNYIEDSAFENVNSSVVLKVSSDSYAQQYAAENQIPYILLDGPKTGDANGDGMVDILDSTEIQKFAAEMTELTDEQFELADINDDGFVDVIDALLVQKYVVGKYDIPPIIYNS